MLAARRVPLEPTPEYEVRFAPELEPELMELDEMDEVVVELEQALALRLEDIAGRRIEKIEGEAALRKYRPHAANDVRFIFATVEDAKLRVVLTYFPRKHNYRKKDVKAAARRLRRFLESIS